MKLQTLAAAALAALLSQPVLAADEESPEAQCKKYAAEEAVPAEEMESYVADCVKEMTSAESGAESAAEDAPGKE